jgi:hypothetical protein
MGGPPKSLPVVGEEDERSLLNVLLNELNFKCALQLDVCPITDLSGQIATDQPTEDCPGMLLVGSSHSVRLMDHLESANLRVVDSTVPSFRITEAAVEELAADLAEKVSNLDPSC